MSWPLVMACCFALCGGDTPQTAALDMGARLRSTDERTAALLEEGQRRSATFRQIADAIARTDGIVYVSRGSCPVAGMRACLLHVIQAPPGARYLWIAMTPIGDDDEQLALIAHELQHAAEVLEHAWIRTTQDIQNYYRSPAAMHAHGAIVRSGGRAYETAGARLAAETVRAELAAPAAEAAADLR